MSRRNHKSSLGLYVAFNHHAWRQYQTYLYEDKNRIRKINQLITSINRDGPNKGPGKPEPLKHHHKVKSGSAWSRRITARDRLVYVIKNGALIIISCKYHYRKRPRF